MGSGASRMSDTVGINSLDESRCAEVISPDRFIGRDTKGLYAAEVDMD